ncbi:hypothetical protein MKX03_016250 [Papaver bracteatum]|nr:hypothetical protein MKX03_016250 [Papaver bracteatum]
MRIFGITIVVIGFLLLSVAESLRFDLLSGNTKCIAEDIKANAMTVGKYSIINPSSDGHPLPETHKVTVRVTSTLGNNYHYGDHVETGQFAFTAPEAGDYMACFWAQDHKPSVTLTVDFDWRSGVAAKDWPNVAKKGQIDFMEMELRKLEDVVRSVHDEMIYLREREEEMQGINRATNSKMAWLGFLSLLVCLLVAGLQLWHLKNFFERKKLL